MSLGETERPNYTGNTFRERLTSPEEDRVWSKWIRIDGRIMVPKAGLELSEAIDMTHRQLCLDGQDNSDIELLTRLKESDPSRVDGGEYSVSIRRNRILVWGCSFGFSLPAIPKARIISLKTFRTLCPGFEVIEKTAS